MTSKSLFFNLIKEDLKQRLWSVAVTFLLFFFVLPVGEALMIDGNMKEERIRQYIVTEVQSWLGFQNGYMTALVILLSLILGVTGFTYLHSRQKVDFYHSIPVGRNQLFCVNYFNGLFIVAASYGINLILAMGVAAANGITPGEVSGAALTGFLLFLLHYSMLYTVTVLAMILTGNILVGILGTAVFNFYAIILLLVLEMCYREFFITSYNDVGGIAFGDYIDRFSPIGLFMKNIDKMDGEIISGGMLLRFGAVGVGTVILALLSLWLYKKRGSEAAGKAMAFPVSMPIVRIPIVILSALSGSIFFWFIHSGLGWAVFGLLCGLLLSHCSIEIIYHFDFRKLFSHWKQMLVSAVIAGAVFCGFRYDVIGYDNYIPAEDAVESVGIDFENANNWVSYGEVVNAMHNGYQWEHQSSSEYILNHMELKDVTPVLSLARDSIKRNQEIKKVDKQSDNIGEYERTYSFSIRYNLKNGKKVYRSYKLPGEMARPEIVRIYENPEFLKAIYPIFLQTPEETAWVRVDRGDQKSMASLDRNGTEKAMTEKILAVYQEDLKNLKAETMQKENPIASIQFVTKTQAFLETKRKEDQSFRKYGDITERGYYPLYSSFTNTLELLKECQVDVDQWDDRELVEAIRIEKEQHKDYRYTYENEEDPYIMITDPAEIKQMMKEAVLEEYSDMNPFKTGSAERIYFSAVTLNKGNKKEFQYTISLQDLPETVKKVFNTTKSGV